MAYDNDPDLRFRIALRHKQNGEYAAALSLLYALLEDQPDHAEGWYQVGLIHSYQVEIDESLAALKMALALQPDSQTYLTNLCKTLAMFGEYRAVEFYFNRLKPWEEL